MNPTSNNEYSLSVVTISLNSASTIEKAIVSVQDQTYDNIEHIIIDGGSNDGTVELINKRIRQCDKIVSEPDRGIFDAMNKGIALSGGEILFFLNSDDYFFDRYVVSDVIKKFEQNPDIDIVFGDQVFDHGRFKTYKVQDFPINREQLARTTIQHQTIFAKKGVFLKSNGFSIDYPICGDYNWVLKVFLTLSCSHEYIKRYISVMATNGVSWTNDFETERIKIMRQYYSLYEIIKWRVIPYWFKRLKRIVG